jgi:hypothetical protein
MIRLIDSGRYDLIETKTGTKVLKLNDVTYAWVNAKDIGEILVTTHKQHKTDAVLSIGRFNIYEVKDEPDITDLFHLELEVGENIWQSYLLLTGLPDDDKKRTRIIPTSDVVTTYKQMTPIDRQVSRRGPTTLSEKVVRKHSNLRRSRESDVLRQT